jgi:hypothetical protein
MSKIKSDVPVRIEDIYTRWGPKIWYCNHSPTIPDPNDIFLKYTKAFLLVFVLDPNLLSFILPLKTPFFTRNGKRIQNGDA